MSYSGSLTFGSCVLDVEWKDEQLRGGGLENSNSMYGLLEEQQTTIDYTYDPLSRLTAADYSTGEQFGYIYDAVGNVLTKTTDADTTSYLYNEADQLVTSKKSTEEIVWHYAYDNAGRLTGITPDGIVGLGARKYTYNTAGLLIRVEEHDGTAYQPLAEMVYNGMGQRLQMTAWAEGLSLTTDYTLDMASGTSDLLAANADGNTTFYLFAHAQPVGEMTDAWSYYLYDGLAVPRQMTDASGVVTLMRRYTPWGEVMQQSGMGNFTWGYFGGLMDAATGLLYIGNGQYYDPATGRFLTPVNQTGPNPYVPWRFDPLGALLGPVALIAWRRVRKHSKRSKVDIWLILLVAATGLSIGLVACRETKPCPVPPVPSSTAGGNPSPSPSTSSTKTTKPNETPGTGEATATAIPPTPTTTPTPEPTKTPTGVPKHWLPDKYVITHYATVKEDDTFFTQGSGNVPIETTPGGTDTTLVTVPVLHFYVGNAESDHCGLDKCVRWSVYQQGSGELTNPASLSMSGGNNKYVQTDTNNQPTYDGYKYHASYYFTDEIRGACNEPLDASANIIAVASNKYGSLGHSCGDKYYIDIPGFENTIFTVKDKGSFVVGDFQPDHFDIYVGTQTHDNYYNNPEFTSYDGKRFRVAPVQP